MKPDVTPYYSLSLNILVHLANMVSPPWHWLKEILHAEEMSAVLHEKRIQGPNICWQGNGHLLQSLGTPTCVILILWACEENAEEIDTDIHHWFYQKSTGKASSI